MPINREFIFGTDAETCLSGLIPTWIADATPARGIAHDMLEHRLKEVGSPVTAELQAIGAIVALRLENGSFSSGRPHAEVLALMIYEMLRDMYNGKSVDPAGPTRPVSDLDEWVEHLLQEAIPMAFRFAERGGDDLTELTRLRESHMVDILGWVRRGYRNACKRYRHVDRYYVANSLFKKLNRASEELVDLELLEDGDHVSVSVCLRRGDINFRVNGYPLYH